MARRNILTKEEPGLYKKSRPVTDFNPRLHQLLDDMAQTLATENGVGLAAPQVGKSVRVVVIDLDVISEDMPEYKGFRHAFINPHIIEFDDTEKDVSEEGCLSLPGIHEKVTRPTRIHVKYLDEQLLLTNSCSHTTSGWRAIWHASCSMSSTTSRARSSPTASRPSAPSSSRANSRRYSPDATSAATAPSRHPSTDRTLALYGKKAHTPPAHALRRMGSIGTV